MILLMPDAEQENAFIETFLVPERRERYKQLLSNPKRRADILDRLNHNLDFLPSLAFSIPGGQHNAAGIARLLNERGIRDSDNVYIFPDVRELDGLWLPMRQAIEEVKQAGFGSVVCCVTGRLAYYRPEEPANGYILETAVLHNQKKLRNPQKSEQKRQRIAGLHTGAARMSNDFDASLSEGFWMGTE
jgi:hypothetical protein